MKIERKTIGPNPQVSDSVVSWQNCPLLNSVVMSTGRYATLCIRENPGCLFIATNRDAVGPINNLQEGPGSLFISHPLSLQNKSLK